LHYELSAINDAIRRDTKGFLAECDAAYEQKVQDAARRIAEGVRHSPIVLLSGPSGSGKTTTAGKIDEALERLGIRCHTISMDDYFQTVDPATCPRTEDGDMDFESPLCLDIPLLNQHFDQLERGEEIVVPKFVFSRQMRDTSLGVPLRLGPNEAIIFEGIHALNDLVTDRHPNATKVYISARSHIYDNGREFFRSTWTRLLRRCVRDNHFRGTDVGTTMRMWANVRRGEKLHISPYKDKADVTFNTSLAYEVPVLAGCAAPLFRALPASAPRVDELETMLRRFDAFLPIDPALVAEDSLLREFIGNE
jgi:uridine kinase